MSDSISSKRKDTEKLKESSKKTAKDLAHQIPKTIKHFFPKFKRNMQKIKDYRKRSDYELSEILMGGINLFLFKEGSRNALNQDRNDKDFMSNYEKLFGMKLPHMDTVDDVFREIGEEELEKFKTHMIRELIEKKVLHKNRLSGKYFVVAVDGSGVMSFKNKQHCDKCLTRVSKKGNQIWFHNVLEAKLVLANGLTISLATEWIENKESEYDKQDCELKAFERLSEKLKKNFPRLPICIVGDGLYPNQRVFGICKENNWEYIITLKDGNLSSVWEEVKLLLPLQKENRIRITKVNKKKEETSKYRWITQIEYKGNKLNWIELEEENAKKYVFVTSLKVNEKTAASIVSSGRLRWKIENEGFNEQKNGGYELEHKYSEVSLTAAKNYYQSLQIASIINQLLVLGQKLKRSKITIKHIWKNLLAFMLYGEIDEKKIAGLLKQRVQIRLE
jgi:hypothetical protein